VSRGAAQLVELSGQQIERAGAARAKQLDQVFLLLDAQLV
jgi:ABC-type taurine transport system ATPase subunit